MGQHTEQVRFLFLLFTGSQDSLDNACPLDKAPSAVQQKNKRPATMRTRTHVNETKVSRCHSTNLQPRRGTRMLFCVGSEAVSASCDAKEHASRDRPLCGLVDQMWAHLNSSREDAMFELGQSQKKARCARSLHC